MRNHLISISHFRATADGAFFVWKSKELGNYVLSIAANKKANHYQIQLKADCLGFDFHLHLCKQDKLVLKPVYWGLLVLHKQ